QGRRTGARVCRRRRRARGARGPAPGARRGPGRPQPPGRCGPRRRRSRPNRGGRGRPRAPGGRARRGPPRLPPSPHRISRVLAVAVATRTGELTERSALNLARAIAEREVSSREVVERHIEVLRRADVNAVVVERFDEALAEADAADARVAEGDDLPPLLGVPFTIKESIAVAGLPNSAGLMSRKDRPAEEIGRASG